MAFVGREVELDLLTREIVLALETSSGRSLFVGGPPGAGKTSLVTELLARIGPLRPELRIARGRCLQTFGSADPYLPFVEALRDLSDESTAGHVDRETLSGLLTELAPYWLSVVPMVGSLLSAGFATAARLRGSKPEVAPSREALFVQYLEVLRRLARQGPLLLFLDDLQWADHSSIALLSHLSHGIATLPVVVIGTLRSDEAALDKHPIVELIRGLEREDLGRVVEIGELSGEALNSLIGSEFSGEVSEPLRRWLVDTAGGNPLFATELARLLKQNGAAVESLGEWKLTEAVKEITVPRSAEAVIESRIQRLDPEGVKMLQYASVEGNEFSSTVLARLLEQDELQVLDALEKLERQYQLVRTTGEVELPDGDFATTFAFRHALVQTVLYRQVTGKRRILLHRRAGEILESLFLETTPNVAGKLARHFHEGRLAEPAHRYAWTAADAARRMYAHWEAEELFRIALEHSPGVEPTIRIEERLADIYDTVGYYDQALDCCRSAFGKLSDDAQTSLRLRRKIVSLERKSGLVPAPVLLQRLRSLIAEAPEDSEEHCYLLLEACVLPDAVGVVEAIEGALHVAERQENPLLLLQVLDRLSAALIFFGNRPADAFPHLDRALALVEAQGDPLRGGPLYNLKGIANAKLGRFQDALDAFQQALALVERVGDPRKISVACTNIGCLLLRLGEYDRAEKILLRAQAIHRRGYRAGTVQSLFNLAERARLTGDLPLAIERYSELIERAREFEYWNSEAVGHAGLGLALLAAGREEDARDCAMRALAEVADRDGWFEDRDLLEIFLARLELADGNVAQAVERLTRAATALEPLDVYLWARVELERAHALRDVQPTDARAILERVAEATEALQSPPLRSEIAKLLEELSPPAEVVSA